VSFFLDRSSDFLRVSVSPSFSRPARTGIEISCVETKISNLSEFFCDDEAGNRDGEAGPRVASNRDDETGSRAAGTKNSETGKRDCETSTGAMGEVDLNLF
jgi:hypothetical protein